MCHPVCIGTTSAQHLLQVRDECNPKQSTRCATDWDQQRYWRFPMERVDFDGRGSYALVRLLSRLQVSG